MSAEGQVTYGNNKDTHSEGRSCCVEVETYFDVKIVGIVTQEEWEDEEQRDKK